MLFNSFPFLIFFPVVTVVFFLLPHRFRWAWLLATSCFFYMFFIPVYIFILLITILIDYFAGILIEKTHGQKKKNYLFLSIVSTCAVLFFFKYFNFFVGNVNSIANLLHWNYSLKFLEIILPIGLSFHTFQSLSYVIEVYKGKCPAERHFGVYALYVMFYPQLVAGPIERPQHMLPQFHEEKKFDYSLAVDGLRQILLGVFKKVFIADRLAILVNMVYNSPTNFHGVTLISATVFFAFQIYCDFSGYSDIALGSARVMGFKLMNNFNFPYFSKSIGEFWKRWHISLSTWFRDYVYIPLGGNRVSKGRWVLNILITFLISGFWHGASWTFVIWGGIHGIFLIFETFFVWFKNKIIKIFNFKPYKYILDHLSVFLTFCLVCVSWIFFRASSLKDALYIVQNLFIGLKEQSVYIIDFLFRKISFSELLNYLWPGAVQFDLIIAIVSLVFFILVESKIVFWLGLFNKHKVFRWSIYYFAVMLILFFGVFDNSQFIYFQF